MLPLLASRRPPLSFLLCFGRSLFLAQRIVITIARDHKLLLLVLFRVFVVYVSNEQLERFFKPLMILLSI